MSPRRSTPQTMHRAGELRKSATPAEALLWARLRRNQLRGISFRRQHAIGPFVVDFCAAKQRLVIEVDGSSHRGSSERDAKRTAFLESRGYRVLRFWDSEVLRNSDSVCRRILDALDSIL